MKGIWIKNPTIPPTVSHLTLNQMDDFSAIGFGSFTWWEASMGKEEGKKRKGTQGLEGSGRNMGQIYPLSFPTSKPPPNIDIFKILLTFPTSQHEYVEITNFSTIPFNLLPETQRKSDGMTELFLVNSLHTHRYADPQKSNAMLT